MDGKLWALSHYLDGDKIVYNGDRYFLIRGDICFCINDSYELQIVKLGEMGDRLVSLSDISEMYSYEMSLLGCLSSYLCLTTIFEEGVFSQKGFKFLSLRGNIPIYVRGSIRWLDEGEKVILGLLDTYLTLSSPYYNRVCVSENSSNVVMKFSLKTRYSYRLERMLNVGESRTLQEVLIRKVSDIDSDEIYNYVIEDYKRYTRLLQLSGI